MRVAKGLIAATFLSGCAEGDFAFPGLAGVDDSRAIRALTLMDGAAIARGPEGYCVDMDASSSRRGFAVLAGCALIVPETLVMPSLDGLITVQLGDADTAMVTGGEAALEAFLQTEAGMALLDDSGMGIDLIATRSGDGIVWVRFDPLGPPLPGTDGSVWRGFLDLEGRLATVTVRGFDRAPLGQRAGRRLIETMLAELVAANRGTAPAGAASEAGTETTAAN